MQDTLYHIFFFCRIVASKTSEPRNFSDSALRLDTLLHTFVMQVDFICHHLVEIIETECFIIILRWSMTSCNADSMESFISLLTFNLFELGSSDLDPRKPCFYKKSFTRMVILSFLIDWSKVTNNCQAQVICDK